jgi:hypothetical protein
MLSVTSGEENNYANCSSMDEHDRMDPYPSADIFGSYSEAVEEYDAGVGAGVGTGVGTGTTTASPATRNAKPFSGRSLNSVFPSVATDLSDHGSRGRDLQVGLQVYRFNGLQVYRFNGCLLGFWFLRLVRLVRLV